MLDYFYKNRLLGSVLLSLVLLMGLFFTIKPPAYAVFIDGKEGFIVKHSSDVKDAINKLSTQKINGKTCQLELGSNIQYKRVFVSRNQILPAKQVEAKVKEQLNFQIPAVAIVVNGQAVAYLDNKANAEKLLSKLKSAHSWTADGEKLVSVQFDEKVKIEEKKVSLASVLTDKEAWNLLTTGTNKPEKYTIEEGDTLWTIARKNDMYVNDILVANNLKEEDILDLGQEIILNKTKPFINVVAKVEGQRDETIPFQTKVIVDKNSAYSVKVKQEGVQGEKTISYVEVRRNGITEKKEILEEKILKNAVDKIVVKGSRVTMVASRGGASGSLSWPVFGTITQGYRGSSHTGIDIGGGTGTPVKAASSGVVSSACWSGGYGKQIVINHGNGVVTRYAHCNSINVSVGQHVSQGQMIGTLGSTGNSTGPHLHFEVIINGSFTNPLSSLR